VAQSHLTIFGEGDSFALRLCSNGVAYANTIRWLGFNPQAN